MPTEESTANSITETGGIPEITLEVEVSGMTQTPVDKTLSIPDMAADAKATGDAISEVRSDVSDIGADMAKILQWTGENIPLNSTGSMTIAEAFATVFTGLYPVGSLFITASETLPEEIAAVGTWTEVAVPLTWGDIRTGARSYVEPESEFVPGNLHFWLRTA